MRSGVWFIAGVGLAGAAAAAGEVVAFADTAPTGWFAFAAEVLRAVDLVNFLLATGLVFLLGMVVDLAVHLRVRRLIPEGLLVDVQEEMANGEYEKAFELSDKANCLIGQIFAAALAKTDYSFERMEDAMHGEVAIQGMVWRQWVGQFRTTAVAGFILGLAGALVNGMRFAADLAGRPNIELALASSFELRAIIYNILLSLFLGCLMSLVSLAAYALYSSKLEKVLLEAGRLGEELLDPFRPLPMTMEE